MIYWLKSTVLTEFINIYTISELYQRLSSAVWWERERNIKIQGMYKLSDWVKHKHGMVLRSISSYLVLEQHCNLCCQFKRSHWSLKTNSRSLGIYIGLILSDHRSNKHEGVLSRCWDEKAPIKVEIYSPGPHTLTEGGGGGSGLREIWASPAQPFTLLAESWLCQRQEVKSHSQTEYYQDQVISNIDNVTLSSHYHNITSDGHIKSQLCI